VYEICNNRLQLIRILALAKSAIRNNLGEELVQIKQPTLLVWGQQDTVTPPFVAEEFKKLIPNSELHFVDKCGHAPMMEQPEEFNRILETFLAKIKQACCNFSLAFFVSISYLSKQFNVGIRNHTIICSGFAV
jgi:alpha-beta hydrolase superfamily lysophospholipase